MAGKRRADNDLNHENWDRDDEPEDSGTFKRASTEALKNRVIKTAKRRNFTSTDEDTGNKSAFAGFSAFSKPPPPTSTAFGFLSNLANNPDPPKTNGIAVNNTNSSNLLISNDVSTSKEVVNTSTEYYAKLKGLNESVTNWIRKKVEENPLINLQPIFKDYEKYFKDLELDDKKDDAEKDKNTYGNSVGSFKFQSGVTPSSEIKTTESNKSFSFSSASSATTTSGTAFKFGSTSLSFSFGSNLKEPTTAKFSFGSSNSTSSSGSFSNLNSITTAAQPFSFTNISKPPQSTEVSTEQNEDDEDTPPKVEFTPVVEKDHIYSIRCKVFVKKEDNFADKGVGNLYLKSIPDNEKVQLIVRADTNLGNLLLNFILSKNVPLKRMGKKDVMLVCLPTPETKPPPVPILLRVKTSEDADNLLEVLEKHKK